MKAIHADVANLIEGTVMTTIRLRGNDHLPVPAKLPQRLKQFAAGISDALKRSLNPSAAIVLRKTRGA